MGFLPGIASEANLHDVSAEESPDPVSEHLHQPQTQQTQDTPTHQSDHRRGRLQHSHARMGCSGNVSLPVPSVDVLNTCMGWSGNDRLYTYHQVVFQIFKSFQVLTQNQSMVSEVFF